MTTEAQDRLLCQLELTAREGDPESAHSYEDELLWKLVALVAANEDAAAKNLALALGDYAEANPNRVRWYA